MSASGPLATTFNTTVSSVSTQEEYVRGGPPASQGLERQRGVPLFDLGMAETAPAVARARSSAKRVRVAVCCGRLTVVPG